MIVKDQTVNLTAEHAIMAAGVATLQMLRKLARGRGTDHGGRSMRPMRERWADGIHGCLAELALAGMLGRAWTPGGMHISHGDVGLLEVRATEHRDGHLIVYEDDPSDAIYVLMIGHYPRFRCAGCLAGHAAKFHEWWRADKDPPSFWIPQSALSSVDIADGVAT